ncbi:MAG: VOC family protein [Bdellovibrionales bacterium]
MAKTNPVGWFEIPVKDISRAKKFYEKSFGQGFNDMNMDGWKMAMFASSGPEAYGCGGMLVQGEGYTPSHAGSLVYFSVQDITATLKTIESCGGKTLMPKKSIGEHGFIAMFEDCEGNRVALHAMG